MAVLISVGGNSVGDGFLLAPLESTYDAEISLRTDLGTASVTLQASPDNAGLVFSQTNIDLTTTPTILKVHATTQSIARGDTTIQVLEAGAVVASFSVTSIKHPVVNFKGRFEARFATQPAFYNQNAMYSATSEAVGPGWTWGLEGEPSFVPAVGNVPENLEMTGVGRVIRLNNPISLRSHAAPVVSTVDSISGTTATGTEVFSSGDPLIGQPVNFGADTYFAGNRNINSTDPTPEEFFTDAWEPLGLFELHFGSLFSGASKVGPFTHKASTMDEITRVPDSRPIATGLADSAAERAEFGLPDLLTFSETRIDLLVADFDAMPADDTPQRRNLARRIGHLLSAVGLTKRTAIQSSHPGAFSLRVASPGFAWIRKEEFNGKVDSSLSFSPGSSSVVTYLSEFTSFNVRWIPFSFHTDELCAHHKGSLTPDFTFHGSYTGDPHTRTVDGTSYDFQAVGEFVLLRDGKQMEVQVRQSPVMAANPITDSHTGLTTCVSIITAVAARAGAHQIALQPSRDSNRLQFYLDGRPVKLNAEGIDLGEHRVTAFDANGEMGVRVDYNDQTVVTATPLFWSRHNMWYINVNISRTRANEGIMGFVPKDSWLPRLRNGASLGSKPDSLLNRYTVLYKTFADSWRVDDATTLFVYDGGKSTKNFTDREWPAEKPPCKIRSDMQIPGVAPLKAMSTAEAEIICNAVILRDLRSSCVFDVATTGDKALAEGYHMAQELRLHGTTIQLVGYEPSNQKDRIPTDGLDQNSDTRQNALAVMAKVLPLSSSSPTPTGSVTFFLDGLPLNRPTKLDSRGRAFISFSRLGPGEHRIRATYSGGGKFDYHSCSSHNLICTIEPKSKLEGPPSPDPRQRNRKLP